jgi:glycosyltransferase involved in cell wall biosynthesis
VVVNNFVGCMFEFPLETSIREILPFAILCAFGLAILVQLIYYWVIFSRLAFHKNKPGNAAEQPVSVVICARNEYKNLINNLPLILKQNYPEFEVLVVNDSSEDGTIELLQSMAKDYPHLNIFDLEKNLNFFSGKKFPLSLGIKSAKYDLILLTDADCVPSGPDWIRNMQSRFGEGKEIVLGYGPYKKRASLLNVLIRYDSFMTAVQYLSFAFSGMAYMGVGRNLMYSRELFYKSKGFISHYRLASGDDDLFINAVATRRNTSVEIRPESHMLSVAKGSFPQWLYQKKRHYTTAKYYQFRFKFLLSLNYLTKLMSYALFPVLLVLNYNFYWVLGAFGLFYLTHIIVMQSCAARLNERDLVAYSPLLEIVMLVLSPLLYFTNVLVKPDKWK